MFCTDTPNSGTIAPRFDSIAAYNKAIEEGNKKLDELAHKQFQAMLQYDVPGMDALEKQYKDTKKHLDSLKAELGEVMGAGIHGKKGNQLTGSGWFGRKMDELSADGTSVKQAELGDETYRKGVTSSGGGYADFFRKQREGEKYEKDLEESLDAGEPNRKDDTSVTSYGGGYADFFREQREGGKGNAGQGFGGGYADFFREQREGEKVGAGGSWGAGEKSDQRDRSEDDINIVRWDKNGTALYSAELAKKN